jgi:exopolysaccharide biosynthesis WecB/TagA/CpsF family protein
LENIKELNPDIVVCGMGTPLQEQFLVDLQDTGWNGIGYTCGGFLHQTAGDIQYYPKWVDKYNLRWVYRIYDEPVLFKRYFGDYPKFFWYFMIDYIEYKRSKS